MSSAREVIAKQVRWGEVDRVSVEVADNVISALTAAGFRIVGPGEVDKETVEKCAEVAYRHIQEPDLSDNPAYIRFSPADFMAKKDSRRHPLPERRPVVKLTERIARWLCPDMARKADRYFYLRVVVLDDAKNWLYGHCQEGSLVAQWAIERDSDHWRELGHPATGHLPSGIADFREHLKRLALISEGEREDQPAVRAALKEAQE